MTDEEPDLAILTLQARAVDVLMQADLTDDERQVLMMYIGTLRFGITSLYHLIKAVNQRHMTAAEAARTAACVQDVALVEEPPANEPA